MFTYPLTFIFQTKEEHVNHVKQNTEFYKEVLYTILDDKMEVIEQDRMYDMNEKLKKMEQLSNEKINKMEKDGTDKYE